VPESNGTPASSTDDQRRAIRQCLVDMGEGSG
jgi:hypothetical protein